jgi:hypothetical protein
MTEHEASRTLVKSPPELWAECSDAASLARHLGQFGEIRITRLEPETSVAWEGERASGTVRLEPSGWGTRVVLTALPVPHDESAPESEPEPQPEPLPRAAVEPASKPRAPGTVVPPSEPPEPPAVVPVSEPSHPRATHAQDDLVTGSSDHAGPLILDPGHAIRPGFIARLMGRFGARRRPAAQPRIEAVPKEPAVASAPPIEPVMVPVPPPEAAAVPEPIESSPLPDPVASAEPEPEPAADPDRDAAQAAASEAPELDADAALTAALDSLGPAHHRPFSRA